MTLSGDFMAVVPLEQQSLVRDLAAREGVSTRSFVESVLGGGLQDIKQRRRASLLSPTPRISAFRRLAPRSRKGSPAAARPDEKSVEVFPILQGSMRETSHECTG